MYCAVVDLYLQVASRHSHIDMYLFLYKMLFDAIAQVKMEVGYNLPFVECSFLLLSQRCINLCTNFSEQ